MGGLYDLDYSGAASKADMLEISRASCATITAAKASPTTKLMVSTVSVTSKLGYKGALASYSLKDCRDKDGILYKMYHTITKNMKFFSTALLNTPRGR